MLSQLSNKVFYVVTIVKVSAYGFRVDFYVMKSYQKPTLAKNEN